MNKHVETPKDEVAEAPANLASAICAVMGEIKRLKKADQNKFANYMFTSVDDFKDDIRPRFAKHGIIPHIDQTAFAALELLTTDKAGKEKKTAVIQFDFAITLEHVSTREKGDPERITVALPYTGAQTTGAARSYAIKEWFKGAVLASSGDPSDEADHRNVSEGERLAKAESRALYKQMSDGLDVAIKTGDSDAIGAFWKMNEAKMNTLPKDWYLLLRGQAEDAYKAIKSVETPGDILARAEDWLSKAPDLDEVEAAWSQFEHYQETLGEDDANTLRGLYEAAKAKFEAAQ